MEVDSIFWLAVSALHYLTVILGTLVLALFVRLAVIVVQMPAQQRAQLRALTSFALASARQNVDGGDTLAPPPRSASRSSPRRGGGGSDRKRMTPPTQLPPRVVGAQFDDVLGELLKINVQTQCAHDDPPLACDSKKDN